MKAAIPTFINHCKFEKRLSDKTIKAYQIDLNQFNLFLQANNFPTNVNSITKDIIREYLRQISRFKPKTIKRKIACTKALFNFMEFDDQIESNPFRKLKIKIKEAKILPTVMNISEITCILRYTHHVKRSVTIANHLSESLLRDLAIIELLFATGIRVSELINLKENDIDFKAGLIKVKGKGEKERIIQLCNDEVNECLKEYHQAFKNRINIAKGCFFINRLGRPLSDQSVRFMVKKYAKKAGVKKHITPHVFRHSFATLLLEEDVDIKYIQHMLGHSSISITQIYTHVNQEQQRKILHQQHPRLHFQLQ